jgi:hypothetical protein
VDLDLHIADVVSVLDAEDLEDAVPVIDRRRATRRSPGCRSREDIGRARGP